jgi:hypothetical protein
MGVVALGALVGGGAGICGGMVLGTLTALVTFGNTLAFGPPPPRRRRPPKRPRRYQVQTAPAVEDGEVPTPARLAGAVVRY